MNKHTSLLLPQIHAEHLRQLFNVSKSLSSTRDLDTILQEAMAVTAELTQSEGASILLWDRDSRMLEFVASTTKYLVGKKVPADQSIAGWVVKNNQALISDDAITDERHFKDISRNTGKLPPHTLLGVPLRHKGEMLGAVEAINKKNNQKYNDYDKAVAQALASQVAMAITNARLFHQSDAVAEVMHELKTPLMALTAACELLDRPEIKATQRQAIVSTMRDEIARISKMTSNFLTLSRLDSGRLRLEKKNIDLAELVQVVIEAQRPQADQKKISIATFLKDQKAIPPIRGDEDRLKQVIMNLISNAIKYNKDDGRIAVRMRQEGEQIHLEIADNGIGIAAKDIPHLFNPFYRVPSSEGYTEGTGLGLSIAKKIIEAHNGSIFVESKPNKGTTFHCLLPI